MISVPYGIDKRIYLFFVTIKLPIKIYLHKQ